MGKASRTKQRLTTREKIAIQREAERRARIRNRTLIAVGSVIAVVAIVVGLVVVKLGSSSTTKSSANGQPTGAALAGIVSKVTSVPVSTLSAVGKGTMLTPPSRLSGQPPLTQNGKPEIVYVGAEYCPYCAAERWSLVVALSRFGKFSNLGVTHSDPADVFPKTKTLTFHNSSYTSNYVVFSAVEQLDVNKKPLDTPTAQQQALVAKYDAPPYVSASTKGAIPFIDLGNKYLVSGASYTPQVLAGKSWAQIASALANPSGPIAKAVLGTANVLTLDICKLTGNKPANVCSAAPINSLNGSA
jgi:thiol-disulfide isomerase/thioredoxin